MNTNQKFILENMSDASSMLKVNSLYAINESETREISNNLLTRLFGLSAKKFNASSYDAINATKGDITRLKELQGIKDSLELINSIRIQSNVSEFEELDNTRIALKYLIENREMFIYAYKKDNELSIMLYNNIAMAIVEYTSHLLIASMSFVRHPNEKTFSMSLNNTESINGVESLLYQNILRFNKLVTTGKLNKIYDNVQFTGRNNFTGSIAMGTAAVIGIGILVALISAVIIIRELTYYFYASRIKLSDYLTLQALFIEMNVIDNKMKSDGKLPKHIERQKKVHDLILTLADRIDVSDKLASKSAKKDIVSDKVPLDSMKEMSIMDSEIVF